MPTSISAKKRLRQNEVRRTRNKMIKTNVRGQVRKVLAAIEAGDAETIEKEFCSAVKKLDQAAAKNVFHANKAARTKSRLSKAIKVSKAAKS